MTHLFLGVQRAYFLLIKLNITGFLGLIPALAFRTQHNVSETVPEEQKRSKQRERYVLFRVLYDWKQQETQ